MKLYALLSTLAGAAGVHAQSSEGFPLDVATYLPVDFTNASALDPGVLYNISTVIDAPTVGIPRDVAASSQPYLIMMIDPDVIINSTATTVLHWLQPNMYSTRSAGTLAFNADGINASSVEGASYLTPQPPANQIHRYNILLFDQPANFTVPSRFAAIDPPQSTAARVGFNITTFVALAGLSDPIAANYFRILLNATAEATSSALTMTATSGVGFASNTATSTIESGSTLSGTRTSTASSGTGSSAAPTSSSGGAPRMLGSAKGIFTELCGVIAAMGLWMF